MNRRAKIVCTIGPASISKETLTALIRGGMDVARLNFSHGDHNFHRKAVRLIRHCASDAGREVAILQDLQGIKIRTGLAAGGAVKLRKGREVTITGGDGECTESRLFISYAHLARDASVGDRILLDDGLMELRVTAKAGRTLKAKVIEGGVLRDRKGVNLPGVRIAERSFTDKDARDLALGVELGVDYVAVSFVRTTADMKKVRAALDKAGADIPLIAKIEKREAVENIEDILRESDGVMVARGDLGVEVSLQEVPVLQKYLIDLANRRGKLVITATQMLESMTRQATPTRAEVADVSNAVIDGTDALMLSAETSSGLYPVKALQMMDRIIRKTESSFAPTRAFSPGHSYSEAVAEAAAEAAESIGARYVIAFTHSGYTARLTSKFRPLVPIVAFTSSAAIIRRMALYWGVSPMAMRPLKSTDAVFEEVEKALLERKLAKIGQSVVITASTPIGIEGKTNLMKLHTLGDGG